LITALPISTIATSVENVAKMVSPATKASADVLSIRLLFFICVTIAIPTSVVVERTTIPSADELSDLTDTILEHLKCSII